MKNSGVSGSFSVREHAGTFAEDKDVARRIRLEYIILAIETKKRITLDFSGVFLATQSFVHAMISEALRIHGSQALDLLEFKSCNRTIKSVILTVVEYSLEVPKTSIWAAAEDSPAKVEKPAYRRRLRKLSRRN